jgi:hypothetical protein
MSLRDFITLPHTGSELGDMSFILTRGWTLLIVSFLVFCYLAFRRRASLRPSAIVPTMAESLGKSSVALLTVFIPLIYAASFIRGWAFFVILFAFLPVIAPHLIIGALIWPLWIFLPERSSPGVAIMVVACAIAIALAATEPLLNARFS